MIKEGIGINKKNGINYIYLDGKKENPKAWIGGFFSGIYDMIMEKSVFPGKFDASIKGHTEFLKRELGSFHDKKILEIASGSGNLASVLSNDNSYYGTDISRELLKIAVKKFKKSGFADSEFYLTGAEFLPFKNNVFDVCICNLALNFFPDRAAAIGEVKRVLKKNGVFIASVPVADRNEKGCSIAGADFSEQALSEEFAMNGFLFVPYEFRNGALLYFRALPAFD